MKNKILQTASQMFLSFGFKSVTMDDIAREMAISKKTIYEHYQNKKDLIRATTHFVFENVSNRINSICENKAETSPIQALFDINDFLLDCLKEDNVAERQLQKHYPVISRSLNEKKFQLITEGITENLVHGIDLGFYRNDFDVSVIVRLYYAASIALKDPELFPHTTYKLPKMMHTALLYHIRGIATEKGLQELEQIMNKHKNDE